MIVIFMVTRQKTNAEMTRNNKLFTLEVEGVWMCWR